MIDELGETAAFVPRPPSRLRFWLVGSFGPLALLLLALWFNMQQRQLDTMRTINRTSYEKRFTAADLLRGLNEAESAQRGYVITGVPAFIGSFNQSRARAVGEMAHLDTLYAGDSGQQERLSRLRSLIDAKFGEMDQVFVLRRRSGFAMASARVADRRGVILMQQARVLVAALANAEQATLGQRIEQVRTQYQSIGRFVWTMMAIAGVGLWIALWFVWRAQSERYRLEQGAHAAAARLRTIFASTTDAILILDPAGRIKAVNAAVTRMLGRAPDEMVGQDASAMLDIADREGSFHERIGLQDGKLTQSHRLDRVVRHKDGHPIPVDIALGLMTLPEETDIVAAIRDISERKAVERLKDEFVSTVSHELRTPLTSVVGSLGLLRAGAVGELPDAAQRLVEIAENNSRRLIRLINDILDIEKIGSGRMHFESVPLDLARMLDGAIEGSQGLADTKGVKLLLSVGDRPLLVQGDTDRLLQVVTNLLSNAIRFSPVGGTVRAGVARQGDDAVVTIEDEGPGIPPEFRGRVFERFSQSSEGAAMGGGTGLGLAIAREIIVAHEGRIWFGEAAGGGARFAFSLPIPGPDPRAQSDARPCILVCQAQTGSAAFLRDVLEGDGCLVDCVGTAREALEAARSGRYDGLILDAQLPDDSGFEVVRALRRRADTRLSPIIIISGVDGVERAATAAIEVVDWIDKPVDQDRLVRAVRCAIEHSAATRPTLLHIDDDLDMLEVTANALAEHGRMLRATTVAAGRELLSRQTPDIVILDVTLPDGSGLELLPDLMLADGTAIPTIVYSTIDVLPKIQDQVDAVLIKSRRSLPNLAQTIRRLLASSTVTDDR